MYYSVRHSANRVVYTYTLLSIFDVCVFGFVRLYFLNYWSNNKNLIISTIRAMLQIAIIIPKNLKNSKNNHVYKTKSYYDNMYF